MDEEFGTRALAQIPVAVRSDLSNSTDSETSGDSASTSKTASRQGRVPQAVRGMRATLAGP
jgi:hypothetical protein